MRVLIVDDNPHESQLLRDAMETVGAVEFTHVADGSEAGTLLSNMEPAHFGLILFDWKLMGMEGDEVAKAYLNRPDRDPRIPVVFISSAIPPSMQSDLQARGCTVLAKPIDLEGYEELAMHLTALCAKARGMSA